MLQAGGPSVLSGTIAVDGAGIAQGTVTVASSFAADPLLQSWLQRTEGETRLVLSPPDLSPPVNADATLSVFYPNGTLSDAMLRQQSVNIALSLGILGLLAASVVVLFRLYSNSVRMRASEQEFVASVGHELRTPISVIQASSENLVRGVVVDPARLPRYAEVIHGQVKRLAGMVESILVYSGLQSGRAQPPRLVSTDLSALLRDMVPPLEQLAAERGSRVKLLTEALPATVCTDPVALRLIVENLVVNAVRHADPGEIRLEVCRRDFDTLRIAVEDDGPGIPAREQQRIWDPFVRGDRSARGQVPGSGLGLHLVKRVTVLLGGKVALESPYANIAEAVQKGSRFVVTLPCREECDGQ
jgi:signal transduction histidine kinase